MHVQGVVRACADTVDYLLLFTMSKYFQSINLVKN